MYDLYNIDTTNIFIKNDLLKSQFDNFNKEFKKNISNIYNCYQVNNEYILFALDNLLRTIPEDKNTEIELKDIFNGDVHFNSHITKMYISEVLECFINNKWVKTNEYINNIIPIILQPNRDSYERYQIPSKSIIHLNDFQTIDKLTEYLNVIDQNFNI
jgi:hypothetical protein